MSIPLPVIERTFRCALNWVCGGQSAVNVIHIQAPTSAELPIDAMGALNVSVSASMWDVQSTAASVARVDITPLDGIQATTSFTPSTPANWKGIGGPDWTPSASNLVKLQTGLRGRDRRGRVFLPFVSESVATQGFVNLADVATVQTGWEGFKSGLAAYLTGWHLVVASYDRAHAGAGAVATPVSTVQAESALGTQRRRQSRLR